MARKIHVMVCHTHVTTAAKVLGVPNFFVKLFKLIFGYVHRVIMCGVCVTRRFMRGQLTRSSEKTR